MLCMVLMLLSYIWCFIFIIVDIKLQTVLFYYCC